MWWNRLESLEALIAHGSMAAAARAMNVDKATVSRHIVELEQDAPAALFERQRRGVTLTAYGARAVTAFQGYAKARHALERELAVTDFDRKGTVKVTAPGFFARDVLLPKIPDFLEQHPELSLQLDTSSTLLDLAGGEGDIAIRNLKPSDLTLSYQRVARLALGMFAAPAYLARRGQLISERELSGHDFISYRSGPYAGPGFEWLPAAANRARVTFASDDASALMDAAASGMGLAVLPRCIADANRKLVRVALGGHGVADVFIVTRAAQRRAPRIRAVTRFLAATIRSAAPRLLPTV